MQSPDPGLAVAERENERAQRARSLGAELWSGAAPPDPELPEGFQNFGSDWKTSHSRA